MGRAARDILVTGAVQGVGFRWTAKRIADGLGAAGWVRNNPGGSVSLAVEGGPEDVEAFVRDLDEAMGMHIAAMECRTTQPGKYRDGFDVIH